MLTAGDALTKTLAKSQKVTFWSKKITLDASFFLLIIGDALNNNIIDIKINYIINKIKIN